MNISRPCPDSGKEETGAIRESHPYRLGAARILIGGVEQK